MTHGELQALFEAYVPWNEQERNDRELALQAFRCFDDLLTRENTILHLCASPWIISRDHRQVLLVYHRLYDSWGWSGGHCDGDGVLWRVAKREGMEESGIASLVLADERPIGIDVLSVPRHHKNGALVNAHLHLNVTYLFYGDPALSLSHKADEVKGARWFDVEAIPRIVKEKAMLPVYAKLCERARTL